MAYTFSNIQDKLSSLIGDSNTGTDDMFPLAQRKKELNRGEMRFCRKSKLVHEYTTGTVAASRLAWPSDMLETFCLIIDGKVITRDREVSVQDYERWSSYAGSIPMYYISEESGVTYFNFFGNVNGLTYKLYYIKKPSTDLSADADVSIVPDEFREALAYYAASELLKQIGKAELANVYKAEFDDLVREAKDLADQKFLEKAYANPDTNQTGLGETDVQGGGFDYGR